MRLLSSLAAVLLCASGPVVASPDPAEDKVVCKRDHFAQLGTNIRQSRKICLKASEWKVLANENAVAQRLIRDKLSTNGALPTPPGR